MFLAQHGGVVKAISPKMSTPGRNERTPEEWLYAILYSGQVTRVGQHLALVLFHLANEKGVASLSMRDLQSITGWGRTTICDHLGEIETFIKTTLGRGRAKSVFELQGLIAEAIEQVRSVRQPDTKKNEQHSCVREPDTIPDANLASGSLTTTADANPDTTRSVRLPDTTADTSPFSVRQPDTKPEMGGTIGGETSLSNSKPNHSHVEQDAAREDHVGHGVFVNCETVRHKDFRISLPALEMAVNGRMPKPEVKAKAVAHALQWAAEIEGGKKPADVVPTKIANFLAASLMGDINRAATADARLAKAKQGPKPFKPSRW
jgi:hypothetical protein